MKRVLPLAVWFAVVVAAALVVAHARFTADLSAFLPQHPTPEQSILIDQVREGPASQLLLVAIEGAPDATLASLSKKTAQALRANGAFQSVNNGENVAGDRDRRLLFDHRYLLSERVTAERFTVAGLHAAMSDSLDLLGSSAGLMMQSLITRDPTAELLVLIDAIVGGRDLPTVDGAWVARPTPGEHPAPAHALMLAETRAAGSDVDGQQAAIAAIRDAFAVAQRGDAAARDATLIVTGPPVFAVDSRNTIERDATRVSVIGALGVALLLGTVYRSARALALGLLPMLSGALVGLAVVAAGFGVVHGITLGFGVTLIGEAVDYAIYLFVQRPDAGGGRHAGFWTTIALGVITSAIGFAALIFSGFEGLAQVGVLSISGLLAAAAVTRWVVPVLMPRGFHVRPMTRLGPALRAFVARATTLRRVLAALAVVAAITVVMHRDRLWSDDLASLSPVSEADLAIDGRLRAELGAPDVRDLVVVSATTQEGALVNSERVVAALAPLVADGTLLGVDAPSRYLPSEATQRARQAALPEDTVLRTRFAQALDGLPFQKTGFDGFFEDVAREKRALLTRADFEGTSLAFGLRALLSEHPGSSRPWVALIALRSPQVDATAGEPPRTRVAKVVASLRADGASADVDIRSIDLGLGVKALYAGYLSGAVRVAALGALAIVVLLALVLRSPSRLARVLVPIAASVLVVTAAQVGLSGPLNLFHLVGLLLIVAVGSNYALFFDRRTASSGPATQADDDAVLSSLLLANLTTVIGFGALSFSSFPILHAIGTTVAPGAFLALVFGAITAAAPRRMKRVLSLALCATLAGCISREAPIPMRSLVEPARCARPVDTLVVLLPGAFDHATDFAKEGFVTAVRERGIAADLVLAEATMGYYRGGAFVPRLDADVLAPARARGIRHVWLAGISLGGVGSLIAANERRASVDGLLLMAPYLGERPIVAEVAASGGVARWSPPGAIPPDDTDRRLWKWLQELTARNGTDASYPAVYLGFGVDDRFVVAHRLLAAALPPGHVFTAPGGHDWPAWRAVWGAMLDAAPLPRDASCLP